jgi:hypothetical protein
VLVFLIMTVLVGLFCIAYQRRNAYLTHRQWARLACPCSSCSGSTAAVPEAEKPLYGQVIRRGPAAIEARQR